MWSKELQIKRLCTFVDHTALTPLTENGENRGSFLVIVSWKLYEPL